MDQLLQEVATLVQNGEFQKAKQLADKISSDVDRYNVLGVIFYQEGKLDEAMDNFRKALEIDPTHDDALFNYAKVLFEKNDHFESWRYLTRIKRKTWEVWDMLGDTQLKQNNPAMAIHYYKKAAELSDQQQMKEKYQQAKNLYKKSEKLAIFCLPGLDNFIKDIADILSNIYDVKLVVTTDGKQIVEAYNWADIVWLEWANELAVQITNKLPKMEKRLFCRLHSYEALINYPEQINWKNVDKLILVAEHIGDILKDYHPKVYEQIKEKIVVVPNGLDLNKFIFGVRQPGFNIAVVAHINHKKDPAMWLQVIAMLRKIDERYTLHIAGDFQEIRYANYFKHFIKDTGLEKNVQLYGFVKDVEAFLEDKNYLLSTSIHESFGYSIAEAMARGIKPIIHNYAGSKTQWPEKLIYNFIDEIRDLLHSDYNSEEYRRFVENNCSLEKQISEILVALEGKVNTSRERSESTTSYEILRVDNQTLKVIDPLKAGITVKLSSYEADFENGLEQISAPINQMSPQLLVSDKNIEYMIDFLEKFIGKGVPYSKTLYYAFLKDVYEKSLYTKPPEQIINEFVKLYQSVRETGRIYKPVVAFINENLKGISFHTGQKTYVDIPQHTSLWLVSGRHRVAIANFLGFKTIPTYVLKNRFKGDSGVFAVLPTYWDYYIQKSEDKYQEFVKSAYVGAFKSDYQLFMDPNKKKIVTDFILKMKPKKVLDIGCNRGELSYHLMKHGIEVLGIDITPRESLNLPEDYPFIQMNVVEEEVPFEADITLFLSVYHHLVYNYGLEKADEVFFKLLSKSKYLVFDSGHPQERGIYRQNWINELRKHFPSEKALLDHFSVPYEVLGKWRTSQGDERTIVVFINNSPIS